MYDNISSLEIPHTNNEKENTQNIDDILFFLKYRKIFLRNTGLFICTMAGKGRRKFTVLIALKSLIWHSLVLFHFQTRQYEITMFDHIQKQLFLTLFNKESYRRKFVDVQGTRIPFFA